MVNRGDEIEFDLNTAIVDAHKENWDQMEFNNIKIVPAAKSEL